MKINTEIVDAYLQAQDMSRFSSMWFYVGQTEQGARNLFQTPPDDDAKRQAVLQIREEIVRHVRTFTPCNAQIWDALFADWRRFLDDVALDLIVGCPEPNDAFVLQGPDGAHHMFFDLLCWQKYLGALPLADLAQNLLTHELFHVMVAKRYPAIEPAEEQGAYPERLDAIAFNEGFAHLVSYQRREIETVSWSGEKCNDLYVRSAEKMRAALREKDPVQQARYLYEANFGDYYSKYACMCGMVYLGRQWQTGGLPRLKELFSQGYHGFAKKCTELSPGAV